MIRQTLLAIIIAIAACAADAQSPLPQKMEGRWQSSRSNHSDKVEVKLVRMDSPTTATINVIFWPYCKGDTESKAEFNEGVWRFTTEKNCNMGSMRVRPVQGKNRFEGTYGSSGVGTVYLEWE